MKDDVTAGWETKTTSPEQPLSPWQSIKTAPRNHPRMSPTMIDILAKRWVMKDDSFTFKRFTDCYWDQGNGDVDWHGVDPGWLAVAWMPIPEIPKSYP